jgi:hypothetical protein
MTDVTQLTGWLLLIGLALVLICIFIGIGFALRWIWKKGRIGKFLVVIFFIWLAWQEYLGVYPPESFYAKEFKRYVDIDIPSDAKFINREASSSDFFGDYSACFNFQIPASTFEKFTQKLGGEIDKKYFENNMMGCINEDIAIQNKSTLKYFDITSKATREEIKIGVITDSSNNQVIILWHSW